ncbi:SWIM zinc finger family protein [Porcincola intestinalis]|uniref:SWIM zinc finger family protein n=1 Tax=Porcincola intestinalis TaxID=2606632 RepID=UPI003FA71E2E
MSCPFADVTGLPCKHMGLATKRPGLFDQRLLKIGSSDNRKFFHSCSSTDGRFFGYLH